MAEQVAVPAPDVEFMFSNMNLPVSMIAAGGVANYRKLIAAIDAGRPEPLYAGGYDITPTRRLIAETRIRGPQYLGAGLHQTWPISPLEDMRRRSPFKNRVINAAMYAMMPDTHSSIGLRHAFGDPLLQTVYGDQRNADGTLRDFNSLGYVTATQVTPELIAETGGEDDYRVTHDSLWQRGVLGVIIPSHHLTRSHRDNPGKQLTWRSTLRAIEDTGAQVHGLHVEAGRIDTRYNHDKLTTLLELGSILEGPDAIRDDTYMGEVLARGHGIWRRQRSRLFISDARMRQMHAREEVILAGATTESAAEALQACAQDPEIAQTQQENMYASSLHAEFPKLPVSVEIPYQGLLALRQTRRLSRGDFVSLHHLIAVSLHGFFAGLPR